jgi:hypothetical protein
MMHDDQDTSVTLLSAFRKISSTLLAEPEYLREISHASRSLRNAAGRVDRQISNVYVNGSLRRGAEGRESIIQHAGSRLIINKAVSA